MATVSLTSRPPETCNIQLSVMESDDFMKWILLSKRESCLTSDLPSLSCRNLLRFKSILCDICYNLDTYQYTGRYLPRTLIARSATAGRTS